jgi:F1F0 ATPase subunit 2
LETELSFVNTAAINLILAVLAGLALGLFYFGGLWLTIRRIASSRRPGMLMLAGFVIRLLVTLCGFYLVMNGRWERILACLVGFLAIRFAMTRVLAPGRCKGTAPQT